MDDKFVLKADWIDATCDGEVNLEQVYSVD